jgi:hypothetical protein
MKNEFPSRCLFLAVIGLLSVSRMESAAAPAAANPLDPWTQLTSAESITGIAFANGTFLAGTDNGSFLVSSDGSNMRKVPIDPPVPGAIQSFAYGAGKFVAAGANGRIFTSGDAITWQPQWSGIEQSINSVTFGAGKFVAVGGLGAASMRAILTSVDGIQWTVRELSPNGGVLFNVAFEEGRFIAVGNSGALLTSLNGIEWQSITNVTRERLSGIAYGQGRFVVVGNGGIFSSTDAKNWTTNLAGQLNLFDVAYGSGRFVAAGDDTRFWVSTNGVVWSSLDTASPWPLSRITSDGTHFVAGGESGTFAVSDNGLDWQIHTGGMSSLPSQIAMGNGRMAAVGLGSLRLDRNAYGLVNPLLSSADGQHWDPVFPPLEIAMSTVSFAGGQFIAFGYPNTNSHRVLLGNSHDGVQWSLRDFPFTGFPAKVVYGNGLYAGGADAFYASADGTNWHVSAAPANHPVSGMAFGNNQFVAVVPNAPVYVSTDASNWVTHPLPTFDIALTDIAFGNGIFVAAGSKSGKGIILYSRDAVTWASTPMEDIVAKNFTSVAFGEGWFVVVGDAGTILSSQDGIGWTKHFTGTFSGFSSAAFDAGRFIVVGNSGTVLASSILPSLKISPPDNSHRATVRLRGGADHVYSVETTPTLSAPVWKELLRVTNSTGEAEFSSSNPAIPSQFFRSREVSGGSD